MSGEIKRLLKRYPNPYGKVPSTGLVFGLPVEKQSEIALLDAPGQLVFLDVYTEQEWALTKNSITDIGVIYSVHSFNKLMKEVEHASGSFWKSSLAALLTGYGGLLTAGLAADAQTTFPVITYLDNGENKAIVLRAAPISYYKVGSLFKKMLKRDSQHFAQPAALKNELNIKEKVMGHTNGTAEVVLMDIITSMAHQEAEKNDQPSGEPNSASLDKITTKVCCACSAEMPTDAAYCPKCGAEQLAESKVKFCGQCGNQLAVTDAFCSECGSPQQ